MISQSPIDESPAAKREAVPPSGFSADWLSLREPFDSAARAEAAHQLGLPTWIEARRRASTRGVLGSAEHPWRIIDLACGTGASLRALAPLLGGHQRWLVADHDAELLAHWPVAMAGYAHINGLQFEQHERALRWSGGGMDVHIERSVVDLARHLESLPFEGVTLVTASALLDLVSERWLDRVVALCKQAGAAAMFALSVDGRLEWSPPDESDARASALFEAHQARDKGFGTALGARAVTAARQAFEAAGFEVRTARSDWRVEGAAALTAGPDQVGMLHAMIDGIGAAGIEQASGLATEQSFEQSFEQSSVQANDQRSRHADTMPPDEADAIRAWQQRRRAVAASTTLRVGHVDLIASPPLPIHRC